MQTPAHFPHAVAAAFSIMAAVYASVATVGYWYWGESVSPLATFDLATNSPFSSSCRGGGGGGGGAVWHPWLEIDRILAALVLVTCSAKIPALVMVIEQLLKSLFNSSDSSGTETDGGVESINYDEDDDDEGVAIAVVVTTTNRVSAVHRHTRTFLLAHVQFIRRASIAAAALVVGVAARNELGDFLSLVGGACSMTTSLILPLLFYTKLAWGTVSTVRKAVLISLLVVGVVLLVQVTFQDARQFLK